MALSIKNPATEELARRVAKETGESLTEAIQQSLKERLQRLKSHKHRQHLHEEITDILRRVDELPRLDERPEDEILDYDEHGAPR